MGGQVVPATRERPGTWPTLVERIDMAKGTCSVEGCDRTATIRGWCGKHYQRWRNFGDPSRPSRHDPPEMRLWRKVDKNGPIPEHRPDLGPCWLWGGATLGKLHGYAQFTVTADGRTRPVLVHRFAYEQLIGPIPEGLELDHLCRVRHCVRPSHMEPVTHRENCWRAVDFKRAEAS